MHINKVNIHQTNDAVEAYSLVAVASSFIKLMWVSFISYLHNHSNQFVSLTQYTTCAETTIGNSYNNERILTYLKSLMQGMKCASVTCSVFLELVFFLHLRSLQE